MALAGAQEVYLGYHLSHLRLSIPFDSGWGRHFFSILNKIRSIPGVRTIFVQYTEQRKEDHMRWNKGIPYRNSRIKYYSFKESDVPVRTPEGEIEIIPGAVIPVPYWEIWGDDRAKVRGIANRDKAIKWCYTLP